MKKLLEKFLALSKKTRIISIVLAAVVLCGAITGIAIGASKCGGSNEGGNSSTPTSSVEESSSAEENSIPSFSAFIDEPCTVTIGADDEYVLLYCKIFTKVTISWEGNATVMMGSTEIENGSTIEDQTKVVEFKVIPTTAGMASEVVVTFTEVEKEAAKTLVLGDNAIAFNGNVVEYAFTATQSGTYLLSLADGESNAYVDSQIFQYYMDEHGNHILDGEGNKMGGLVQTQNITFPYEITLAEGETVTFLISAKDAETTEDTINLVWSQKL